VIGQAQGNRHTAENTPGGQYALNRPPRPGIVNPAQICHTPLGNR